MFHIVLLQPQIPPNTGNIMRLCANSGCTLHLVKPLGFELTGKAVRRAGLDYAQVAQLRVHADFPTCRSAPAARGFSASRPPAPGPTARPHSPRATRCCSVPRRDGLSPAMLAQVPGERQLTIPMRAGNRSLNLSNAVALVVYEAWRQKVPG